LVKIGVEAKPGSTPDWRPKLVLIHDCAIAVVAVEIRRPGPGPAEFLAEIKQDFEILTLHLRWSDQLETEINRFRPQIRADGAPQFIT
jgi:hypothetical protein